MSIKATGQVVEVGTKDVNTKFGLKKTYSFKLSDGQWYKLGFKKVAGVEAGNNIEFEYTPGSYGNDVEVTSIKPASGVASAAPKAPAFVGRNGVFPIPALDGQRSIVRQNALTNARELYTSATDFSEMSKDTSVSAQEIIKIARMFEAYTAGDMDLEEAKASMGE